MILLYKDPILILYNHINLKNMEDMIKIIDKYLIITLFLKITEILPIFQADWFEIINIFYNFSKLFYIYLLILSNLWIRSP